MCNDVEDMFLVLFIGLEVLRWKIKLIGSKWFVVFYLLENDEDSIV